MFHMMAMDIPQIAWELLRCRLFGQLEVSLQQRQVAS